MLERVLRVLRTHYAVAALCVFMTGAMFLVPLSSSAASLQQGMPTAVGAAVGAAAVVSGAGWLACIRERQSRLEVMRVLVTTMVPALRYARAVEVFLECAIALRDSNVDRLEVASTVRFAQKESEKLVAVTRAMDGRLLALQPLFARFGCVGAIAYGTLAQSGAQWRDNMERVPWQRCRDCPEALEIGLAQLKKQNRHVSEQVRDSLAMMQRAAMLDPDAPPGM